MSVCCKSISQLAIVVCQDEVPSALRSRESIMLFIAARTYQSQCQMCLIVSDTSYNINFVLLFQIAETKERIQQQCLLIYFIKIAAS